jgi:hypothetical protein
MYWARREKQGATHALRGIWKESQTTGFRREAG